MKLISDEQIGELQRLAFGFLVEPPKSDIPVVLAPAPESNPKEKIHNILVNLESVTVMKVEERLYGRTHDGKDIIEYRCPLRIGRECAVPSKKGIYFDCYKFKGYPVDCQLPIVIRRKADVVSND